MIDRHTMILCLQNGLGNYDEIAKVVPEEQIIIGNTAFGSTPTPTRQPVCWWRMPSWWPTPAAARWSLTQSGFCTMLYIRMYK